MSPEESRRFINAIERLDRNLTTQLAAVNRALERAAEALEEYNKKNP